MRVAVTGGSGFLGQAIIKALQQQHPPWAVYTIDLTRIARHETPYQIGDGYNLYDFVIVDNVAEAHVLAVRNLLSDRTAAGQTLFISNGEPVYFRALMLATWAEFGHIPPFEVRIPPSIAAGIGAACEWLSWLTGREASLSRGNVLDAIGVRYADIDKARRLLEYTPRVGLADGLRDACRSYQKLLQRRVRDERASMNMVTGYTAMMQMNPDNDRSIRVPFTELYGELRSKLLVLPSHRLGPARMLRVESLAAVQRYLDRGRVRFGLRASQGLKGALAET